MNPIGVTLISIFILTHVGWFGKKHYSSLI